ncbi:hypothetical protein JS530_04370 [Bifidobacterium sp. LC6]|uniref:Uncharacterized protein n=1 Tax=Bifidobacterium colobi TaxID=2809026 RepID=A0ABS5UUR5_9BIFI|nr:hypothetical protein [Bifidobacterium colobi]
MSAAGGLVATSTHTADGYRQGVVATSTHTADGCRQTGLCHFRSSPAYDGVTFGRQSDEQVSGSTGTTAGYLLATMAT